jgi:SAM-dependent methyltransferase
MAERSADEFVEHAYRLLLRRAPLPEDLERCAAAFGDGTLSRATLLHELVTSDEFARLRALDDAIARSRLARRLDERPRGLRAPPHTDERPIEIAWVLARYRGEPRVLDVGSAHALPAYLDELRELGIPELTGVDPAPAEVPGLRMVAADVRELPFPEGSFDVCFCISTLEHVGRDNRQYGLAEESDAGGPEVALRELARVLGPSGRLLATVPCGQPANHGAFIQHDPDGWLSLFERSGLRLFEVEVYELGDEGWRPSSAGGAEARYGERGPGASAVLCAELRARRAGRRARRLSFPRARWR